jgi:hypothetical protein
MTRYTDNACRNLLSTSRTSAWNFGRLSDQKILAYG